MATSTMLTTDNLSASNIRDVSSVVSNVSPSDSPFYSKIGETGMTARLKEHITDTLGGGTAINAIAEGDTFVKQAMQIRGSISNYAQIISTVISVTGSQEAVSKYAIGASELNYQVKNKFKELAKDCEYSMINGTATAGTTATGSAGGRKMAGLKTIITTNTATASGAAATGTAFESKLNDLFQLMYESGVVADTVLVEGGKKRLISALTTNVKNSDAAGKKLVNTVNVYESDFGEVQILLDRYVPNTYLYAVAIDSFRTAYLRRFQREQLAKTGDSLDEAIIGELTLDYDSELAGGRILFS